MDSVETGSKSIASKGTKGSKKSMGQTVKQNERLGMRTKMNVVRLSEKKRNENYNSKLSERAENIIKDFNAKKPFTIFKDEVQIQEPILVSNNGDASPLKGSPWKLHNQVSQTLYSAKKPLFNQSHKVIPITPVPKLPEIASEKYIRPL